MPRQVLRARVDGDSGTERALEGAWQLRLQSRYDLELEKDRLGDALDGIRPLTVAS